MVIKKKYNVLKLNYFINELHHQVREGDTKPEVLQNFQVIHEKFL